MVWKVNMLDTEFAEVKRKITPVLLAGGSGTRLWPLSRSSFPKQFSKVIGSNTLFQSAAKKLTSSKNLQFNDPIVVTSTQCRFIVGEQLKEINIKPSSILVESEMKNTAAAILAATLHTLNKEKNSLLLVAPTDHMISSDQAFHNLIREAIPEVNKGQILTIGIYPTTPETGYGYLELVSQPKRKISKVKKFVEKPNLHQAKKMIKSDKFLWNAGIFLFSAKDMIQAFNKYEPELIDPVQKALDQGIADLNFFRLNSDHWAKCKNISIDYAIMEKAQNLSAIPYSSDWSDLGNWQSVWHEMGPDRYGVALSKNATSIKCKNTLLRSESNEQQIVGIGLDSIIAIAMKDAVLVTHKSNSEEVNLAVKKLTETEVKQASHFPKVFRPWGWFETLAIQDGCFQVKKIVVNSGATLSLQTHKFRSEHWTVVKGEANVTIENNVKILKEGESIFVPQGAKHRMGNEGNNPMVIIEVQTGSYLGEDDITRFEDIYARNQETI